VMETLAGEKNLEDPKAKIEIASQVLPLIQDVPSPIERDTYIQRLARLLRVNEKALTDTIPAQNRVRSPGRRISISQPASRPVSTLEAASDSSYLLEVHCLGILLRKPGLLYVVDRNLQQEGLARLSTEDFEHADHRAIIRLFQDSVDQDLADPLNYVLNSLSLPMMDLADDLLERTSWLSPNEQRVLEDLMRGLLDLRQRKLHQEIEYQMYLIAETQNEGDVRASQHMQYMVKLADAKRRIDQAMKKYTSRELAGR